VKIIATLIHALGFYLSVLLTNLKGSWKPKTRQQEKVKITKMALKAGDSYRLGEAIVTLATFGKEGKQEVAAKIAAIDKMREEKHQRLTERAEQIMLMSPEQLKEFQIEEWVRQRKAFNEKKFYDNQGNAS
jgi:hypothetical protein